MIHVYEERLLERDALKKELHEIQTRYLSLFGDLLTELMELKLECIKRKKAIRHAATCKARHEIPDLAEIRTTIEAQVSQFKTDLETFVQQYEHAKKGIPISHGEVKRIKSIYRSLAHLVHPDLHPENWNLPGMPDLWDALSDAYNRNDLEAMEEVQVLILAKLDGQTERPDIPDLEGKIHKVQLEIEALMKSETYKLKDKLENETSHRLELQEQVQDWKDYLEELDVMVLLQYGKEWDILWQMN